MLTSIDVLIGLIVILLALSMTVTVITQGITTMINSRGKHLRRGITDMLQQLDPALTETLSRTVATHVLTHPLVSGSAAPISATVQSTGMMASAINQMRRAWGGARLGNVVHREEFTRLLMGLATGDGTNTLPDAARNALVTALARNGIEVPETTLKNIRTFALQLERTHPALSNMERQRVAILQEADSDLVAKINNWFDQTMDRTSQRFTASTRAITLAGAFIVAFGLQVDTPSLVNRLAADDELRARLVQEAASLSADPRAAGSQAAPPPRDTSEAATKAADEAAVRAEAVAQRQRSMLAAADIITLPSTAGWWTSLKNANHFGILLTALLLSLGAPFWYGTLGKLLQLRSVLAVKEDALRTARQSSTEGDPAAIAASPGTAIAGRSAALGERGDPLAVG